MRCRQYQKRIENDFDNNRPFTYTPAMLRHKETCPWCRDYAEGLVSFTASSLESVPVKIPPELQLVPETVIALEAARRRRDDWKGDVKTGGIFIVVAIALWITSLMLSPIGGFAIQIVLVAGSIGFLLGGVKKNPP